MATLSKSESYNAGRQDAIAGKPRNWTGHVNRTKYSSGYNNAASTMRATQEAKRDEKSRNNPMAVCAATGVKKPEMSMGAYDSANDEFFLSPAVMDAHHGVAL